MSILSYISTAVFVFAPIAAYVPQYFDIKKRGNSDGFSPKVCLILLLCNILRIYFWMGRHFDTDLLWQSVFMIVAQFIMLHLCVSLRGREVLVGGTGPGGRRASVGPRGATAWWTDLTRAEKFWNWTDFSTYITFIALFTAAWGLLTFMFVYNAFYVELLGTLSLTLEAMLGVPQAYKNFKSKSTEGLSLILIGIWFLGDGFKTVYFLIKGAPTQFLMCGIVQLVVDSIILVQMSMYRKISRLI
eukprot:TRINITY_DN10011_c0_g1_i1.p1 TRINITY_DN10011_c0_g1~~TRINITY_DN10011_c0_g1_i1.p1  ORF type:complete len:244 (-),score=40.54 TRINITY_DN10011_c0_g1_i1:3-734(-)